MAKYIECPKCGGQGGEPGENFGDYGWHPCFFCGTDGFVTQEQMSAFEASEAAAEESESWRFDDYPADYWDEASPDDYRALSDQEAALAEQFDPRDEDEYPF